MVTKRTFGKLSSGEEIQIFHLENKAGAYAEISQFGAILVKLCVSDREGKLTDVVLGYDDLAGYEVNGCFFGATIGRSGNRIANSRFALDGQEITLTPNEQLEYDNPSGEFNKKIIDASVYSGWTRGELNFAAMTLSDIFITIERIYDIHIIVPPHLATTDVYTIKFKQKAPIKEIMNIVTKTIGNIDYKVEDENILLIYSPLNKKGGR